MNNNSNKHGFGSTDWLVSAIKKNPEGLLLMAAGCALLLRTGNSSNRQRSYSHPNGDYSRPNGDQRSHMPRNDSGGWDLPEGISRVADTAREYASDVGKTVNETAGHYASAAGEYVEDTRRAIMDESGRIAEQTQSTIERIVREQPIAVAIAGLAAGAAVAAAFPATQVERDTLGSAGKRLSEAATSAGDSLSEAASAAGERLATVAEKRGLSTDGLKEAARDVAGAFEKSLSSGSQDKRSDKFEGMSQVGAGSGPAQSSNTSANPATQRSGAPSKN